MVPVLLAILLTAAPSQHRVEQARKHREAEVRALFAAAKVGYPAEIYLRAFKREGALELWAGPRGGRMTLVHTFAVCAASGELGPKRRRGDLQVPEGLYAIDRFNPVSAFHLSLGLNYPNAEDRAREGPGADLGGDIFLHGGCATIGCLPLTDEGIEKLYLVALDARGNGQRTIPIDLHPTRPDEEGTQWLSIQPASDQTRALWSALRSTYDAFERTRRPPPRASPRPREAQLLPRTSYGPKVCTAVAAAPNGAARRVRLPP